MSNQKTNNKKEAQAKIVKTIYDDFSDASKVIEAKSEAEFYKEYERQKEIWWKAEVERRNKEYKEMKCQEALKLTEKAKKQLQEMLALCKSKSIQHIDKTKYKEIYLKKPSAYLEWSLPHIEDYFNQIRFAKAKMWLQDKLKIKWFSREFKEAENRYNLDYEKILAENEEKRAKYNEWVEPRRRECEEHIKGMIEKRPNDVWRFFLCALEHDSYKIGGNVYKKEMKNLAYKPDARILSFAYKLPNLDELALIKEYKYSEEKDDFDSIFYSQADEQKHAIRITDTILLRVIATIFMSDEDNVIDMVDITGYVKCFVKGLGNFEDRDYIHVVVNRKLFDRVNLDGVDASSFFSDHVKAKFEGELYKRTNKGN